MKYIRLEGLKRILTGSILAKIAFSVMALLIVAFFIYYKMIDAGISNVSSKRGALQMKLLEVQKEMMNKIKTQSKEITRLKKDNLRLSNEVIIKETRVGIDLLDEKVAVNFSTIVQGTLTLIRGAMLEGNALLVNYLMENLQSQGEILAMNLWRAEEGHLGEAAFHDNYTINRVNKHLGDESFEKRSTEEKVMISNKSREQMLKMTMDARSTQTMTADFNGQKATFSYSLLVNNEECQVCHGDDHEIRGILEVTLSLEKVIAQQEAAKKSLKTLEENQEKKLVGLTKIQDEKIQKAKAEAENLKKEMELDKKEIEEIQTKFARNRFFISIIFIIALVVPLILLLQKLISQPIAKVMHMITALSEGRLENRLKMRYNDEIADMGRAMNKFADELQMEVVTAFERLAKGDFTFEAKGVIRKGLQNTNENLNKIMAHISTTGDEIASGAVQVSDASQSLSEGASEQASSLEEVTSSMDEMGAQTKHNAENATQANQLAVQARSDAEKGNEHMKEMIQAMREINESSKNISGIIKVIDEIAFQTNLLALNAAVEAARAGKHGKGFAVVAEEVRNLATRSAEAAKETEELIESSIKKVENGSDIANNTEKALNEIASGVSKVTDLVGEIAVASNEQAQGITQINQSLEQIDNVTQQNSANAEESAAASEKLAAQANNLKEMLSRFKLKENGDRLLSTRETTILEQQSVTAIPAGGKLPKGKAKTLKQPKETKIIKPSDIIGLDDEEFGKF